MGLVQHFDVLPYRFRLCLELDSSRWSRPYELSIGRTKKGEKNFMVGGLGKGVPDA